MSFPLPLLATPSRRMGLPIKFSLLLSIIVHAAVLIEISPQHISGESQNLSTMRIKLSRAPTEKASAKVDPVSETERPEPVQTRESGRETSKPVETADHQPIESVQSEYGRQATVREEQREQYIEQLLRHIESHKYYPAAARRRGIEDRIRVRFKLYGGNDIREVEINGRSGLLKRVAREVLQRAMPFRMPPADIMLPLQVEYAMNFEIQ